MAKSKSRRPRASNRLRIIAGHWRGRVIDFPDSSGLRPTTDRIRETLFNWLQTDLPGARCLDLFAGSGALGFEAASRGASKVTLVESSPPVIQQLLKSAETLKAMQQVQIVESEAQRFLQQNDKAFDIIFLDPPFASSMASELMASLAVSQSLRKPCKIYLETALNEQVQIPAGWDTLRGKSSGQVSYRLMEVPGSGD